MWASKETARVVETSSSVVSVTFMVVDITCRLVAKVMLWCVSSEVVMNARIMIMSSISSYSSATLF